MNVTLLIEALAGLGAILVVGFFHTTLTRLLLGVLARPSQATVTARDVLRGGARRLREWSRAVRQAEGMAEPNVFSQRLFGAIACTACLAVFLVNEAHFGVLSWTQYVGTDASALDAVIERIWPGAGAAIVRNATSLIAALGVVVAGLFWGMVLFDLLGATHLGPWGRIERRCAWMAVTAVHLALVLAVGLVLAETRVLALESVPVAAAQPAGGETVASLIGAPDTPSAGPTGLTEDAQRPLAQVLLLGHAALMLTSSVAAGWGAVAGFVFLKILLGGILRGALYLLGLPIAALDWLLNWLGQAVMDAYELIARCCVTIARPFGRRLGSRATDVDLPVGRGQLAGGAEEVSRAPERTPADSQPPASSGHANNEGTALPPDSAAEDSHNWAPYTRPRS